jgi:hypothetical protein
MISLGLELNEGKKYPRWRGRSLSFALRLTDLACNPVQN